MDCQNIQPVPPEILADPPLCDLAMCPNLVRRARYFVSIVVPNVCGAQILCFGGEALQFVESKIWFRKLRRVPVPLQSIKRQRD